MIDPSAPVTWWIRKARLEAREDAKALQDALLIKHIADLSITSDQLSATLASEIRVRVDLFRQTGVAENRITVYLNNHTEEFEARMRRFTKKLESKA